MAATADEDSSGLAAWRGEGRRGVYRVLVERWAGGEGEGGVRRAGEGCRGGGKERHQGEKKKSQ